MIKTKRDPNKPSGRIRFIIFWTLGMLLAQMIAGLMIIGLLSLFDNGSPVSASLAGVLSSLILTIRAFIEVQVVERLLKRSMRGWTLYTITGFVTTVVLCFILLTPFQGDRLWDIFQRTLRSDVRLVVNSLVVAFLPELPTLAFQTVWLRRHVKQPWLWLIVGVALMLMLAGLLLAADSLLRSDQNAFSNIQSLLILLTWIVSGLAMYHMMTQPKETIKAKHEVAEDESLAEGRIHRLKAEEAARPWTEAKNSRKFEAHFKQLGSGKD
jgi:hypothetical protein